MSDRRSQISAINSEFPIDYVVSAADEHHQSAMFCVSGSNIHAEVAANNKPLVKADEHDEEDLPLYKTLKAGDKVMTIYRGGGDSNAFKTYAVIKAVMHRGYTSAAYDIIYEGYESSPLETVSWRDVWLPGSESSHSMNRKAGPAGRKEERSMWPREKSPERVGRDEAGIVMALKAHRQDGEDRRQKAYEEDCRTGRGGHKRKAEGEKESGIKIDSFGREIPINVCPRSGGKGGAAGATTSPPARHQPRNIDRTVHTIPAAPSYTAYTSTIPSSSLDAGGSISPQLNYSARMRAAWSAKLIPMGNSSDASTGPGDNCGDVAVPVVASSPLACSQEQATSGSVVNEELLNIKVGKWRKK